MDGYIRLMRAMAGDFAYSHTKTLKVGMKRNDDTYTVLINFGCDSRPIATAIDQKGVESPSDFLLSIKRYLVRAFKPKRIEFYLEGEMVGSAVAMEGV
jgi:hypothetical protein